MRVSAMSMHTRPRAIRDDAGGSAGADGSGLDVCWRRAAEVDAPVDEPQQEDEARDGPEHDADDGARGGPAGVPSVPLRHCADVRGEAGEEVRAGGEGVESAGK